MNEDLLNSSPQEEAQDTGNTDVNQGVHRTRQRIPRGEKIIPGRINNYNAPERHYYNREEQYERRPSYNHSYNNNDRPSYRRNSYLSDERRPRPTNYGDDEEPRFTNNPRTYQDAGMSRENVVRSRSTYSDQRYREEHYRPSNHPQQFRGHNNYENNQHTRNYNNYGDNNQQPRYGNYREHAPRVAYAKGYNQDNRPYQRGDENAPLRKKITPKRSKGMQIPPEVVRYKDMTADPTQPIRLNRYLANAGICSRRDADTFIKVGLVKVNDEVVTEMGTKVLRTDVIKFKNKVVQLEDKIYVLLNKPKDYVTTSEDPQNRKTVLDLVRGACSERIYSVGRLDRNTTGVLLLTNDGELSARLTHPKYLKKKIYHVFLNKEVTEEDMEKIRNGITLEDGDIKADAIEYAKDDDKMQVGIEIHSGKNRIVRRIFESLGYHVRKLDRVYFAGLTKKNLRKGQWRYLTEEEVSMLKMGAFE